jgi:hypothetical protein
MLVGIAGFGSVWRVRFHNDLDDPERFRRAAYFNTTGVAVHDRTVRHRKIAGHARFNGTGGFDAHHPSQMIGKVFECDGPQIWNGQNKVFFRRVVHASAPEAFLIAVRSAEFGQFEAGAPGWKSHDTFLISLSEWRDQQEALFLMPVGSWLTTCIGRYVLESGRNRPCETMLTLRTGA